MRKANSLYLLLILSVLSISSYAQILSPRMPNNRTRDMQIPRAIYDEITPFSNTIRYNYGDSILGLYTPDIGDQGSQGSCMAWAFGYGCAGIQAYEEFQDSVMAKRSPSYIFNQVRVNCSGAYSGDVLYLLYTHGVCGINLMPYNDADCDTQPDSIQHSDAALNKSLRLKLTDSTDISEYKQYLQIGHPIGVVTHYAEDLKRVCNSPSLHGVWNSIVIHNTDSTHALCIVGYDDHIQAFKVMNSWGTSSGDNGYVWIGYNLVQNSVIDEAYVFEAMGNRNLLTILGPEYLSDSSWYYVRNLPHNISITWSITNNTSNPRFTLASAQGRDSMYVANRRTGLNPWNPLSIENESPDGIIPPPGLTHKGTLSVTITCGSNTYTAQKAIREPSSSLSMMPQLTGSADEQILNLQLHEADELLRSEQACTLELWHSIYGRMRTQVAHNSNEQMIIDGLPKGVYVVVLRQSGRPITQTKVIIN